MGQPSTDRFLGLYAGAIGAPDWPATRARAVAPNDAADLPDGFIARALWVGGAGNVAAILAEDSEAVTFAGVPAGTLLPIRAKRILSTGTTASDIVAVD